MTSEKTLAIVGASLAGAKAAEAARQAGYEGRIVLIGDEAGLPYERPPLSKAVLRGEKEASSARVHDEKFYDTQRVELIKQRAVALDARNRAVELAGGDSIAFDAAVLATGAVPRQLDAPGAGLGGVHYLRTIDDSVRLRDAIRGAKRVAVIGAGWIGSEVAASARQMSGDVVLIDPAPVPLQRVLGDEVGEVFRKLHADNGVELRLGIGVKELRGTKTVEGVVLDDGRVEDADVVVVGIGVIPQAELAEEAFGISVDDGVVVDDHLETTVKGIFAAGDVANAWHPHYRRYLRVEHWSNALNQGQTAGRNAAGQSETYERLPYFFSDQFDLGMEYVGYGTAEDSVVLRGDVGAREFIAFWHRDGVVTAAMNVNVWDVAEPLEKIVRTRNVQDVSRLADSDVPLGDLLAEG